MSDLVELLFFDTFAHDNTEEINLDLVQFPKPVYVTEVRIIPLGARVQADFPGGVRLGATNPSQFQIEFFVNDLGKPGASTFETLGGFEYDQNGRIHLECNPDETVRKIPTDGLVLKGWYTTITLAVYGTLTNNITEQIIQPAVNPSLPAQPNTIADAQQVCSNAPIEAEWHPQHTQETVPPTPMEYNAQQSTGYQAYNQTEQYSQEFADYYNDVPKDPRGYHHTPEAEWDSKGRPRLPDTERDRDRNRDLYQTSSREGKSGNLDRDHSRSEVDRRDRDKRFSRSGSRDRDRRDYREIDRDTREHEHEWSDADRSDYRTEHSEHDWNERDRGHDRDRCYKHDDNYRRSYNRDDRERDDRKRPRTPPIQSPKRPHTPHVQDHKEVVPIEQENVIEEDPEKTKKDREVEVKVKSPQRESKEVCTPPTEEVAPMDVEEFEPILSDEDILDDTDHYQDLDYDYGAYTNNDDIIKLFTPGVTELLKYPKTKRFLIKNNIITIEDGLKVSIGIADDYFKSSITKYEENSFDKLNTEIKEEFIHLCEKLISTVGPASTFCEIAQFYVATKSMNPESLRPEDKELGDQVQFFIETLSDWLKIALDYDLANIQDQPAYKIRHIKCGVRLAEWCCSSSDFISLLWQKNFNLHRKLLDLYEKEFMALSIKLMILKALDNYLQHKFAVDKFLLGAEFNLPKENGYYNSFPITDSNGYKILVEYMNKNPLVRVKFSLQSILKKLNLYELLHKIYGILINLRNVSHDISAEEINLITKSLNEIYRYCQAGPFTLSQPKRFLPVLAQFEILRNDTYEVLITYFRMFNLLQCFVLLLTYPSTLNLPLIKTPIFQIVSILLNTSEGLQYMSENSETVNVLLKCLLQPDEEMQYNIQECYEIKTHHLGQKIAYELQALYHIEYLIANGKNFNFDCDAGEIIDQLHALYCLTFSHIGKVSCAKVLGMGDHIQSLLQFLDFITSKEMSESTVAKIKKSVGIPYIVDLIYVAIATIPNISLLEKKSKVFLNLVNQQDAFEEGISAKLNELKVFLIPFENVATLSYDNITPYVEAIDKCIENFLSNIGLITTSLRIIHHLGISPHFQQTLSENPLCHFIELKYKHVLLQLFSADGISILAKFLQKICDYYEQPSIHSSILVSNLGWQILQMIHPAVVLLKQMLSYVIQCRNTNFRDLTTIPVLLQTYNFLTSYPSTCSGYPLTQEIKANIIDTLLVYTQPVSEEVSENDSLNKTLWTQMCGEVIKYVTTAPYTFISGVLIFSELLPLPLPVQTRDELTREEILWLTNLRKLWSAHLHPHSTIIQDMVNKLCISTQPLLLNLLRRICVQISDLAANSAIMIARGILDNIYDAIVVKDDSKIVPCSGHAARLLNFLACLVTHNTIKCAVLHLIHTNTTVTLKTDEKYVSLIPAFAQIMKTNNTSNSHIQAQECILSIIQSFCDCEISVMQMSTSGMPITSEEYLANAMPVKEHLQVFIQMMLDHLSADNSFVTYLPIVRTFLLLTEHDYGFYNLQELMLRKNNAFSTLLIKLAENFSAENAECLSTINTLVGLLRLCVTVEEENEPNLLYKPRTSKLSISEMKGLIAWPVGDAPESHPLMSLEASLKKAVEENSTFETVLEGLSALLKLLESNSTETNKDVHVDIILPLPETLLVQYTCQTVFSSADACNEHLTARYWLAVPAEEGDNDLDTVPCDLMEICKQNLRSDFNIVKEVEKLCRISGTENFDDKEQRLADENDKMKKPFVTPMRGGRGFARPAPQRGDLFRSRPPNTSRPPSLHVDDFVALETCGAQPTGPTGYNKISRELLASTRMARGTRGRAFVMSERSVTYRQMTWWGAGMGRGPYQM